jgi:hypothetical protein
LQRTGLANSLGKKVTQFLERRVILTHVWATSIMMLLHCLGPRGCGLHCLGLITLLLSLVRFGNSFSTIFRANTAIFKGVHCKKRLAIFPSPAGMSLTKISLAGNNLIIPGQKEFG